MVGIPVEVACVTLWGNMPVTRMDVGFGSVRHSAAVPVCPQCKAPVFGLKRDRCNDGILSVRAWLHLTLLYTLLSLYLTQVASLIFGCSCGGSVHFRLGAGALRVSRGFDADGVLADDSAVQPLRIAPSRVELGQGTVFGQRSRVYSTHFGAEMAMALVPWFRCGRYLLSTVFSIIRTSRGSAWAYTQKRRVGSLLIVISIWVLSIE